jgi:hypothetical protein
LDELLNKCAFYVLYHDEFTIFSHAFAGLFGGEHTTHSFSYNRESKGREICLLADDRRICAALSFYPPALAAYGTSDGTLV